MQIHVKSSVVLEWCSFRSIWGYIGEIVPILAFKTSNEFMIMNYDDFAINSYIRFLSLIYILYNKPTTVRFAIKAIFSYEYIIILLKTSQKLKITVLSLQETRFTYQRLHSKIIITAQQR